MNRHLVRVFAGSVVIVLAMATSLVVWKLDNVASLINRLGSRQGQEVGPQNHTPHRHLLQIQNTTQPVVDGSVDPTSIPDDRAYHVVLMSISALDGDSDVAKARARAFLKAILVSGNDESALATIASQYRSAYLKAVTTTGASETAFEQERLNRIQIAMASIKAQLTEVGATKLNLHTQVAKRRVKLVPLPKMSGLHASLWDRIVSGFSVHAQMNPFGTVYSDLTVYSDTNTLYGYGVTDSSASCTCHSSQVSTTVTGPSGQTTSASNSGAAYVEANSYYGFTDADFVDGTAKVDSYHWSYCPIIGSYFINNGQTEVSGMSRYINAYYYCSPRGGPCSSPIMYNRCTPQGDTCDECNGFKLGNYSNWPAFILANALYISLYPYPACIGGSIIAADGCGLDPKP